jgi:hypothetical protein
VRPAPLAFAVVVALLFILDDRYTALERWRGLSSSSTVQYEELPGYTCTLRRCGSDHAAVAVSTAWTGGAGQVAGDSLWLSEALREVLQAWLWLHWWLWSLGYWCISGCMYQ